jgi:hypothetical protein
MKNPQNPIKKYSFPKHCRGHFKLAGPTGGRHLGCLKKRYPDSVQTSVCTPKMPTIIYKNQKPH